MRPCTFGCVFVVTANFYFGSNYLILRKLRTIANMSQFVQVEQAKQSKRVIEGGQAPGYDQIALIQSTSKALEKMQRMSNAT